MNRQLSTPSAILLGCAMIAAATYFGLRHGPDPRPLGEPAPAPSALATSREAPSGAVDAPAPVALAVPPPRAAVPRDELERQVAQALDAHRRALVERCLAGIAEPRPRAVRYRLDFTFNPQGQQIARGVVEDKETAHADVTACVLAALPPLRIPAPGANVHVELPFSLP